MASCAPTIRSFEHLPNPQLRQAQPFPASVAILPWDDKRQRIEDNAIEALIPLVPYAVHEFQNGPGVDWATMPESRGSAAWYQWQWENPSYVAGAPRGEDQVLSLLQCYLLESNIFQTVTFAGTSPTLPVHFLIRPTLYRWQIRGWQTFYGMSVIGCLPYYLALPMRDDELLVHFSFALTDGTGQHVYILRNYQGAIPQPAYRLYGPRFPGLGYEFEDLLPFVRQSLEDFVRTVQKTLPPPGDTAYWGPPAPAPQP
ncbi:MAG: hypothetical protein N3D11_12405 [Candidatus Sumerlaeia bacterium]|nr:hypothetical protein [Candidatus Sumerlaeia bacterium]